LGDRGGYDHNIRAEDQGANPGLAHPSCVVQTFGFAVASGRVS
jgi:hypothetical protein